MSARLPRDELQHSGVARRRVRCHSQPVAAACAGCRVSPPQRALHVGVPACDEHAQGRTGRSCREGCQHVVALRVVGRYAGGDAARCERRGERARVAAAGRGQRCAAGSCCGARGAAGVHAAARRRLAQAAVEGGDRQARLHLRSAAKASGAQGSRRMLLATLRNATLRHRKRAASARTTATRRDTVAASASGSGCDEEATWRKAHVSFLVALPPAGGAHRAGEVGAVQEEHVRRRRRGRKRRKVER